MIARLKKRAQFLALRQSPAVGRPGFLLVRGQCPDRQISLINGPRVGFTVTKKIGNAVRRNRLRRRLKAAVEHHAPLLSGDPADYIFIARSRGLSQSFEGLCEDVGKALTRLQQNRHKTVEN
ncbi:MAG: ribonuclease P protein component [Pseudomonadota bacterium]